MPLCKPWLEREVKYPMGQTRVIKFTSETVEGLSQMVLEQNHESVAKE